MKGWTGFIIGVGEVMVISVVDDLMAVWVRF